MLSPAPESKRFDYYYYTSILLTVVLCNAEASSHAGLMPCREAAICTHDSAHNPAVFTVSKGTTVGASVRALFRPSA